MRGRPCDLPAASPNRAHPARHSVQKCLAPDRSDDVHGRHIHRRVEFHPFRINRVHRDIGAVQSIRNLLDHFVKLRRLPTRQGWPVRRALIPYSRRASISGCANVRHAHLNEQSSGNPHHALAAGNSGKMIRNFLHRLHSHGDAILLILVADDAVRIVQ